MICTVSVVLVVYCRLVVHIETRSDTRAQKWLAIAYSSLAHYRIGCAPQLYCHYKSIKMVSHIVLHYRIVFAHDQHWEEQTLSQYFLLFVCLVTLVCTHCPHIFLIHKSNTDANTKTIHQLLHLISIINECWIIEENWRFIKTKASDIKAIEKKVR